MNVNVFQAAQELNVKKIIFSSSIQALGAGRKEGDSYVPTLTYLPVDGDTPACPTNVYGLSKQLSEEMLHYYARDAGMTCIALRFPWLVPEKPEPNPNRGRRGRNSGRINEAWSFLSMNDAARLIEAVLASSIEGFRIYCPVASNNSASLTATELLEGYFSKVLRKRLIENGDSVYDISQITEETGWQPENNWNFG